LKKALFALIILYVLVYLLPLGNRPMVVPDEMRYGEIAGEMITTGDWVVPRLMEFRYFEKPALGHWLNAAAMLAFGENRFGARFASAASVGLAALALFLLVRRERDAKTGALAAFILLTCAEIHFLGTYSALDSMVTAFITLSLCCFYPALSATGRRKAGWLFLTGIFVGCAFLVKGFLSIAIPVMVIAPFLLLQKRWKDLFTMPWLPLAGLLGVSLPWCIAIGLRESDYWNYFFIEEHIHRFFAKGEAEHAEPFWFFIPVLLLGALPWTLVAPIPIFKTMKERWADPFVTFAALWFILPFLFFSASSGKLGTYILPCYAPLAILLAIGLTDCFQKDRERFFRVGARILCSIFVLGFIGLAVSALLPLESAKLYAPFERYKYVFALISIGSAAGLAFASVRHNVRSARVACFGAAMAVGIAGVQFCVPESRSVSVSMERFLISQKEHLPTDALMVADSRTFTGVGFILGRSDVYILGSQGELDYGLAYEDSAHRFLGGAAADLLPFFEEHRDRTIVVVTREDKIDPILQQLPEPIYQDRFRYLRFYVFAPSTERGSP
jgi:4-amino-4-deoxy-L-arabinose transferase